MFGRKESIFLLTVFSIQAFCWITINSMFTFLSFLQFLVSYFKRLFTVFTLFDFLSGIALVIYLFIRPKTMESLKKFKLFRFIYFMIAMYFVKDLYSFVMVRVTTILINILNTNFLCFRTILWRLKHKWCLKISVYGCFLLYFSANVNLKLYSNGFD